MMKNLFHINEDEKNRILNLHESATKKQYLIIEGENDLWYSAVGKIKNAANWNNAFGQGNWEVNTDNDEKYEVEIDVNETEDIAINISMEEKIPGYMWFDSWRVGFSKKGGNWNFDGQNFSATIDGKSVSKPTLQEVSYHFIKHFYSGLMTNYKKPSDLSQQPQQQQQQGGGGTGNQGWDLGKVMKKYPCLYGSDFAEYQVYSDQYGDVVKLNLGKNKSGQPVYGKMFVQDGYLVNWDTGVRIGKDDQYMTCKSNKLSFQTGKNFSSTDQNTGKPMNESINKVGKIILEDISSEVTGAAGGSGGGNSGGDSSSKKQYTGPSRTQKIQTKLKEIDPNAPQTGNMDQATINLIMNLITNGKPSVEQKPENLATDQEKINNTVMGASGSASQID